MGDVEDFLAFRKFITTRFITIIYVLGALFITFLALAMMIEGSRTSPIFGINIGIVQVYYGLFLLTIGNLLWRMFCEIIIVQFRIHEELVSISNKIGLTDREIVKTPPVGRREGEGLYPSTVIKCPYCGSEIPSRSRKCPVCRLEIPPPPSSK